MKERILVVIKDEGLLEESATALHERDYLVTKSSNISDMESHLSSTPQDVILLDSNIWMEDQPELIATLTQNYSETPIIHLVSNGDQETLEKITLNGEEGGHVFQPVTGKELQVVVDQVIKYRQLKERYSQMRNEFLEANKNLSNKSKELQDMIAFHHQIFQGVTVGIATVDTHYIITSWNAMMTRLKGIQENVAMGSNLFDIFPSLSEEKISERVKDVIQKGEIVELGHLETEKPDGNSIFANYKISPLKKDHDITGAVIILEDITKKAHLQEEVDRSYGYMSYMVANATDIILSFDLDGTILTWNKGAEKISGYSAQEAIGRSWDFLFPDHERRRMHSLIEWVKQTDSVNNFETQMMNISGELMPISLSISVIKDKNGHTYGLSGIAKDLSEAKKFQKQIIQSQKMLSLGAMASSVAHDINNPLASLSSYTHLLMTRTKMFGLSELTDNLSKVEEDAEKISQLVKDLLWYSTPSDRTTGIVDIHGLLKKSIIFTSYQTHYRNIEIKRDYFSRNPQVVANGRELIQAFVNILNNAVDAMPEGGSITLHTSCEAINDDQEKVLIKIQDTGIGIPEANLPRIFEQFFTTKPEGKGNGLGLYVARAIIENHHGEISVDSVLNQGTTVTIRLPIKGEHILSSTEEEKG